jgi:hypothetical protein
MTKPARRAWTATEQKQLDDLVRAGKSAPQIAIILQRTRQAIYARLQRLDVKRKRSAPRLAEIGLKPREPMGCKLVGTVRGTKLWAGDCEAAELRGSSAPATETPSPPGQKQ